MLQREYIDSISWTWTAFGCTLELTSGGTHRSIAAGFNRRSLQGHCSANRSGRLADPLHGYRSEGLEGVDGLSLRLLYHVLATTDSVGSARGASLDSGRSEILAVPQEPKMIPWTLPWTLQHESQCSVQILASQHHGIAVIDLSIHITQK